jgi:beta-N-acetylhexosaminidase
MLIISSHPQEQAEAYAAVVRAVEEGQISREQIDAGLNRILKLKERYLLRSSFVQRLGPCGNN